MKQKQVFFWNSLAFSMAQQMLAIWSLFPLLFLNPAYTSGSSRFMYYWSLAWRILRITLLACEMSAIVGSSNILCIAHLWDWNENWPFWVLWPLLHFLDFLNIGLFAWITFFHPPHFQFVCVHRSGVLKKSIQPVCLLVWTFNPFTFKVIIDVYVLIVILKICVEFVFWVALFFSFVIWLLTLMFVRGRSALRDPTCYSFLLCAISQGFSIPCQFLENRDEQRCRQFSGLRSWERASAWIPFSDSLQWPYLNVIYSVMPLLLRKWNVFWPFEDFYLLGFVFAQFF